LDRLLAELPRNVKVAMTLHPAVWFGHGPRQVNSWLRGHRAWAREPNGAIDRRNPVPNAVISAWSRPLSLSG
jgi:hypothetical protein